MDKLARQLREDAASIDAGISAELDSRIRASLQNITPESAKPAPRVVRSPAFWWASSLTGVAAALAVIAVLNVMGPDEPVAVPRAAVERPVQPAALPGLDLDVRAAMLADPLAQELEDLQADLKKAEELVRGDVRIDF